jgi:carbonic anhydrase
MTRNWMADLPRQDQPWVTAAEWFVGGQRDPAIFLGLRLGDAFVIRNAGGRITQAVIDDIAYLSYLAQSQFGDRGAPDSIFEVAVVHHTQCGTGLLADPAFRHQVAKTTGPSEAALEASAVADPHATVKVDVGRLLSSALLSPKVSVSGHVYEVATGRLTTILDAQLPRVEAAFESSRPEFR